MEKQECFEISDKTQHEFISCNEVMSMERLGIVQCGIAHCRELFTVYRKNQHKHMLLYTVKGKGWITCNLDKQILEPGSLAIVPAGLENGFSIEEEEWQIAWIFLSPNHDWSALVGEEFEYHLTSLAEVIYANVLLLLRARNLSVELSCVVIENALSQIELFLKAPKLQRHSDKKARLNRVFDTVQMALHRDWNVGQIAALYPCSPPHLHRLCQQTYGHSPKVHITRMRMEYAARLLSSTTWAIQHIGEIVGYPIAANFTARFKAWCHKTPRQFRKENSRIP
ncbi:AraC family transcriptional regulator [Vibrio sp. TRT 17S01]|uniref:AraC family transcriptional regulator n=1 Tax=Vibrio sp. TRT 17S01 TaxID=3418505 RepID=UPI003CF253E9